VLPNTFHNLIPASHSWTGRSADAAVMRAVRRILVPYTLLQASTFVSGWRGHYDGHVMLEIETAAAKRAVTGQESGAQEAAADGSVHGCGGESPVVQVFSDVDDTFFASAGSHGGLAGCDKEYGKKVIYPGYTQFVLELSRGPKNALSVLRPGLLSARPANSWIVQVGSRLIKKELRLTRDSMVSHAFNSSTGWDYRMSDVKMEKSSADLWLQMDEVPRDAGNVTTLNETKSSWNLASYSWNETYADQQSGVDIVAEMRDAKTLRWKHSGDPAYRFGLTYSGSWYGQISDGTVYKWMGTTKFAHMKQFFRRIKDKARTKDLCVVFIGDNGQGDCDTTAQRMKQFKRGGQLGMKAAFIHTLTCATKEQQQCPHHEDLRGSNDSAPVIPFRNYLDAAAEARKRGLISEEGFWRVAVAVNTFVWVHCHPTGVTVEPKIVTDEGCKDLLDTMTQQEVPQWPDLPILQTRSVERKQAFCTYCCADGKPSLAVSYGVVGDDDPYHCREGYRLKAVGSFFLSRMWRPAQASERDCSACTVRGAE